MPAQVSSSRLRVMSGAECAWVGAFIEADGTVVLKPDGQRWVVAVRTTEVEYLSALLRSTGGGYISLVSLAGHPGPLTQNYDFWAWQVQAQADVRNLAEQCAIYSLKLQRVLA